MATRNARRGSRAVAPRRTVFPASGGNEALNSRWVSPTYDNGDVQIHTNTANTSEVRIKVGTDTAVTTGTFYTTAAVPDAQGEATNTISNGSLTRGSTYYYRVLMDSTEDSNSVVGRIVYAPTPGAATNFAFCFGSCTNATDADTFTTMRTRGDALFLHLGDLWYADDTGATTANFRTRMQVPLSSSTQGSYFATTSSAYTPSDHDCAMTNNGNGADNAAAVAIFNAVYREKFPTSNLVPATSGVYQTFAFGRVRFVILDTRTLRSSPSATDNSSKSMLGTTQKTWLKNIIDTASEPVLVIASDVPWAAPAAAGGDNWSGYTTERTELGNYINASNKSAVIVSGDMHAVGWSDGASNGLNIYNFAGAPFTNNASIKGGPWNQVYPTSGTSVVNQYGRVVVTDTGTSIALAFTGYSSDNTSRVSTTKTFAV